MNASFLDTWNALSTTERDLVVAMSMVYEERSVLDLSRLLNKIGLRPPPGEPRFMHASTEEMVHKMGELGLLVQHDDRSWRIAPEVSEKIMRRASLRPDFQHLLNEIRRELPYKTYWQPSSARALMREIRINFYLQNESQYERLQKDTETFYPDRARSGFFVDPLFDDFNARWVETLPKEWRELSARRAFRQAVERLEPLGPLIEFLEQYDHIRDADAGAMRDLLGEAFVLQGSWSRLQLWADLETDQWRKAAGNLIYRVLRDDDEGAEELIGAVRAGYKQEYAGKFPAHLAGYFYLLSLLRHGGVKGTDPFGRHLDNIEPTQNLRLGGTYLVFKALHAYLRNDEAAQTVAIQGLEATEQNAFTLTFRALYDLWTNGSTEPLTGAYLDELDRLRDVAQENGYRWMELELTKVLSLRHTNDTAKQAFAKRATALTDDLRIFSLSDAMPRIEPWERALEVLATMSTGDQKSDKKSKKTARFVWFVDFENKELEPREQTLGKKRNLVEGPQGIPQAREDRGGGRHDATGRYRSPNHRRRRDQVSTLR